MPRLNRSGSDRIEAHLARKRRHARDIDTLRRRLAEVSWFMEALRECLARRFHRESNKRGTFRECRFGCRSLEDEAATLL